MLTHILITFPRNAYPSNGFSIVVMSFSRWGSRDHIAASSSL